MIDQADKSEALAAEFKDILKTFKDKDTLLKVNKLMKDKGVSIKELEMQTPEVLTELIDFAKTSVSVIHNFSGGLSLPEKIYRRSIWQRKKKKKVPGTRLLRLCKKRNLRV